MYKVCSAFSKKQPVVQANFKYKNIYSFMRTTLDRTVLKYSPVRSNVIQVIFSLFLLCFRSEGLNVLLSKAKQIVHHGDDLWILVTGENLLEVRSSAFGIFQL